jgi:isocitrate/isopropylmalate dehydrogenase
MKKFKIAVIPGDGIGKEVMPEGLRALEAAGRKFGIQWTFDELDWSCDYHDDTCQRYPARPRNSRREPAASPISFSTSHPAPAPLARYS